MLILFDGGLNTSISSVRAVILPASLLATIGVLMTAGIVALFARLFGLSWPAAMLLGAVVSSTDAAAVFAVLRGGSLTLRPRVGRTIEVESCINDPMAVILTTTLIAIFSGEQRAVSAVLLDVPLQLAIGVGVGIVIGLLAGAVLCRLQLRTTGLYPAFTLAMAMGAFGLATVAWGSGFLAVYVAGLVMGNTRMPQHSGLIRVHDALAWLSQIGMFLMLGLLVFPSRLLDILWIGLAMAIIVAGIARPAAGFACLAPIRYPTRETLYVSWIGLRGAVPIILATFPVLANVPEADRVFNIVFFIVVASAIFPGATIRWVTRRMNMDIPQRPTPPAVLEINSIHRMDGNIQSFHIDDSVAVCNALLAEIEFPQGVSVLLIVRDRSPIPAKGKTRLQAGDHVYLFFPDAERTFIELLFGSPEG
ncbi:MAG TPA: potassium/proton antiporter [Tepidisphaeraceae bacterium]|nr:potassium/proton antiporter [Tepidisphaeraceae bacterium]